jgi:crotonobetainyl-CoA:carnitine CoA-transferase CaiB-like acyl-CoA transferase
MHRLIDKADVFVQNFAPSAAERLGLGAAELRARNPRLITCSITGYGTSGPYRDAKAYDLLIQSEAGLVSVTGTEDLPAKSGIPAADIGAGMYAFAGILAALYDRERTGVGAELDVSLFDSLIEWMGYPLYYTRYGGQAPGRTGTNHAAIAPYGTYAASDGQQFVLSIQNEREWKAFCTTVLRTEGLANDPRFDVGSRRVANRDALDSLIAETLGVIAGDELAARLQDARIATARRREVVEVLDHPQLAARQRWTTVDSPVGELDAILPPINIAGFTYRMDPIPGVGEHTRALLREVGYSEAEIEDLSGAALF